MRVLLIDMDKTPDPNLALMKFSAYHKERGDEVGFDVQDPEQIFVSVVFDWNKEQAAGLKTLFPGVPITIGGSGWDLHQTLPPEIELIKPDYDLYPSVRSQGFSTRGCVRKCEFCIVPRKEGKIRVVQHPCEFHDDRFPECMLMDNNILGVPDHAKTVLEWFRDQGVRLEMTQGYDFRLLTEEFAGLIKDVKHNRGHIRFAWDNIKDEPGIIKAVNLLKNTGFDLRHDVSFYVLAGFKDSTFEDALYRCNRLKEMNIQAFVMPYRDNHYRVKDRRLIKLAKWANRPEAFWSGPFKGARA